MRKNAFGLLGMTNNTGGKKINKAKIKMSVFIIAFTMVPGKLLLQMQGPVGLDSMQK